MLDEPGASMMREGFIVGFPNFEIETSPNFSKCRFDDLGMSGG